jgi:hypothetical protein
MATSQFWTINPSEIFYEKPVADEIKSVAIAEIVADIYQKYQAQPIDLLMLVHDIRWLYEGNLDPKTVHGVAHEKADGAPSLPASDHYLPSSQKNARQCSGLTSAERSRPV